MLQLRAEKLSSQSAGWNDEQSATLIQIAAQCRYEGGIGVVLARAELDKILDYNDEEMCPDLTEERARMGVSQYRSILTPNPARDFCQIVLESPSDAQIDIYNLQGNRLRSSNASGASIIQLDISGLLAGIYIVEIQTLAGREMHKLLILH